MSLGIRIPPHIGIGDAVQFTSLPENYYKTTGKKLHDVSRHWVFDHNPYVIREGIPDKIVDLWEQFMRPIDDVKFRPRTNAEIHAWKMDCDAHLIRPKLYHFESGMCGFHTVVHAKGVSQGQMAPRVALHINKAYPARVLLPEQGPIWELVRTIASSSLFIGVDSGPSWIAACYPEIIVKKLRSNQVSQFEHRIPMDPSDHISQYDDLTLFKFYNATERDIGFTESYLKL